ncbi:MAG: Gfo/Idh/MocA family oxidoreductase [Gammaproteobacteria bacterium]|nr:Gfo/Idh/MocA family oxidoreductase [Gammaproteobacteria bacterium]
MGMFKKVIRYIFLYGLRRTLVKVLYQIDRPISIRLLKLIMSRNKGSSDRIGIIGLGNHGFTLIAFFVCVYGKKRFSFVIDPSDKSKLLAENVLSCKHFRSIDEAIEAGEFRGDLIYIASDHYSHTSQAIMAADKFQKVYIEKPLFVNFDQQKQFLDLLNSKPDTKMYTGFNRPFAPYFEKLQTELESSYSVTVVVNGHYLPSDHWYRNEGQGTRVLGNLTHWLDLSLRLLSAANIPKSIEVKVTKGALDDLSVTLLSGDRKIDLLFSANCEPLDGVEEFIFWNSNLSVGKIMNFKSMDLIRNDRSRYVVRKRSKNVGHCAAVLAPLKNVEPTIKVAYLSSFLAIMIEDMYVNSVATSVVELDI